MNRPQPTPFVHPKTASGSLVDAFVKHLTAEIHRGVYQPGDKIPSQRELCENWKLSATTVKTGLLQLVEAQVLNVRDRAGYFVAAMAETHIDFSEEFQAQLPAEIERISRSWGEPASPSTQPLPMTARPFAARVVQELPIGSSLSPAHTRVSSVTVRGEMPTADIAAALRMAPDPYAPVITRHRLITDLHGTPVELRSSYLPAALAEGTRLLSPTALDGIWHQLIREHTGHNPQSIRTQLQGRLALDFEAQALGISPHAMVIVRDTTLYPTSDLTGPALDFTRSVLPAETTRVIHADRL